MSSVSHLHPHIIIYYKLDPIFPIKHIMYGRLYFASSYFSVCLFCICRLRNEIREKERTEGECEGDWLLVCGMKISQLCTWISLRDIQTLTLLCNGRFDLRCDRVKWNRCSVVAWSNCLLFLLQGVRKRSWRLYTRNSLLRSFKAKKTTFSMILWSWKAFLPSKQTSMKTHFHKWHIHTSHIKRKTGTGILHE